MGGTITHMDDTLRQQEYYDRTAGHYEAMHVHPLDEHAVALAMLAGFARHIGARSILDVGGGTGRAVKLLQDYLPGVKVVGVEPVAGLREVGYANGIARDALVDGSGEALPFADDAFDLVIETAVLHHVPDPAKVVREMCRVASRGVMISDSNNLGQGSWPVRLVKGVLHRLGLWRAFVWLGTGGKMSKYNEGDGVFYSYTLFDSTGDVARKFPRHHWLTTRPTQGFNLRFGAPVLALIALKDPW